MDNPRQTPALVSFLRFAALDACLALPLLAQEGNEAGVPNECCPPPAVNYAMFGGMNLGEQAVDFRDAGYGATAITVYGSATRELGMPEVWTGLQGLARIYASSLQFDVTRSAWDGTGMPLIQSEIPVPDLHYENLAAESVQGPELPGQGGAQLVTPSGRGMVQPRPGTMPGLYLWHHAANDTFYQYGSPVESGANPQSTAIYPPGGRYRTNQLSGALLVVYNPGSGASYGQNGHYVELKHVDGTVARFEHFRPFVPSYSAGWIWRLVQIRDPYDNLATLSYDLQHRLTSISFPSGLQQSFDYAPAWPGWTWNDTTSGFEVRYAQGGTPLPGRSWGLALQGAVGTTGGTHFALRPFRLYSASRRIQKGQSSPGTPLVADTVTGQVVHELSFDLRGSLAVVTESNHVHTGRPFDSTLLGTSSLPGLAVLETHFDTATRRAVRQLKPMTQVRVDVTYPPAQRTTDLLPGETLTAIEIADAPIGTAAPNRTRYEYHYGTGKVYSIVRTAGDDAEGRPRAHSGVPMAGVEPERIEVYRLFDGTCVCQKPAEVRLRSLVAGAWTERTTRYQYDPATKLLRTRWEPNPATFPGPTAPEVEYRFTYIQARSGTQSWGAWLPETEVTPIGTWTYHYSDWLDRANQGNHGRIAGTVERRSDPMVTQPTLSGPTGTGSPVSEIVHRNLRNNPGGLGMSGGIAGLPRRVIDGDRIAMTFEYSAQGWRTRSLENNGRTLRTYSHDGAGNVTHVAENDGSAHVLTWTYPQQSAFELVYQETALGASVPHTRLFHYDRYGHLAVVRRNNLASDGSKPAAYGSSSNLARDWVEAQWIYQHHQLWERYEDRLPLDQPAGSGQYLATRYQYHENGQLAWVANPNGSRTAYEFDGYDSLYTSRVEDPTGSRTVTSPLRFVNPFLELIGTYHVAGPGNTLQATIVRNGAGAITEVREPMAAAPAGYTGSTGGAVHRFEIDVVGRIAKATSYSPSNLSVALQEREMRYDQLGRRIWQRDAVLGEGSGNRFVAYRYEDGKERLQSSERSGSGTRTYGYEPNGLLATVLDTAGDLLEFQYHSGTTYPSLRRRIEVEPDGTLRTTSATYEVDPFGQVLSMKDGVAQLTYRYHYGSLGRMDRFVDPKLRVQRVLTDAQAREVERVRIGDGGDVMQTRATFVDSGRPDGRTLEVRHDDLGNQHVVHYDFAGRPIIVQNPGSTTEPTSSAPHQSMSLYAEYDEASRLAAIFDGDGGKTLYWHDGPGRLIQRELVAAGTKIALWNSKDVFTRDVIGRTGLVFMNGGGPAANHGLTVAAELIQQDSVGRVHGETFWSGWSPANVVEVKSTFVGGSRQRQGLEYDDNLPVGSSPLAMTYGHDTVGRLQTVDWTGHTGASTRLASYGWVGSLPRERKVRLSGGAWPEARSTFDYDEHDRLQSIRGEIFQSATPPATPTSLFDYEYDEASNLTKERYAKRGGGAGDRFSHDAYHRLTKAWLGASQTVMDGPEPTGYVAGVAEFQNHALDGANNRSQLDVWTSAAGPESKFYALQGGSHPQGPSNRYDSVGAAGAAAPYEYDERGNLTYDGRFYYKYDYLSRLQEVWKVVPVNGARAGERYAPVDMSALEVAEADVRLQVPRLMERLPREHTDPTFRQRLQSFLREGVFRLAESGGVAPVGDAEDAMLQLHAVYTYDAFNRRVGSVVVGGQTETHAWDRWRQVTQSVDVGGYAVPVKQFVWGAELDELIGYRRNNAGTWENYHLLHGGQHTAAKLVNGQGQVVEHYEYDPYGTASVYVGSSTTPVATSSVGLPFLYKAMEVRPETGLTYARNRWYSAELGRFLSSDLLGVYGDALNAGNQYAYAGNRPLVIGDPLGLQGGGGVHVLMTNFGGFMGDTHNSSQDFTGELGKALDKGGVSNETVTLPVEWDKAQEELKKAMEAAKKKADKEGKQLIVIATGQGLDCFELEENGKNERKPYKDEGTPPKTPGKGGTSDKNDPSKPGSDSKPAPAGAGDIGKAGGMGSSSDAGGFICDSVTYELYKQCEAGGASTGAFVHVPNEPDAKDKAKRDAHDKKVKDTAEGVAKHLCEKDAEEKKKKK